MFSHWQCSLIGRRIEAYRLHRSLKGKPRSWERVGRDLVEFDYTLNPDNPRETNAIALGESLRRFTDPNGRGSVPNDTRMAIVRDFLISEGFLDAVELEEVEADGHLFSRLNAYLSLTAEQVPRFADHIGGDFLCVHRPEPNLIERSALSISFQEGQVAARVVEKLERYRDPGIRPFEAWTEREQNAWRVGRKVYAGWAIMSPHWGATLVVQESYGRESVHYGVLYSSDKNNNREHAVDLVLNSQQTIWADQRGIENDPAEFSSRIMMESGVRGGRIYRRVI